MNAKLITDALRTNEPITPHMPADLAPWRFNLSSHVPSFTRAGQRMRNANTAAMLGFASRFVQDIRDGAKPYWITFVGKSGLGKTHLAKRIVSLSRTRGGLITWPTFEDAMLRWEFGLLNDLADDELVCLDDILATQAKSIVADKLYGIMERRLGKWTIITANMGLGDIASINARMSSRMLRDNNIVVECEGTDYAMQHK